MMRCQKSVSKKLSHLQLELPPKPAAVRKMPSSGEFVEIAADHEPAARRPFASGKTTVPFQLSLDRQFSNNTKARRVFSSLATNIVVGSPAQVNRLLSAGEDTFTGFAGMGIMKDYGHRVKRSWLGKHFRALMGEDTSQRIVEVPVESAELEELLRRAAEEDRCAKETCSKIPWRPVGPSPVSPVPEHEPLRFEQDQDAPCGPRRSDTSEELADDVRTLAVEGPVCAAEALAESESLLNEASSVCTPRSSHPGRDALLIKDAAASSSRGASELRELVRIFSFGAPHQARGSLELHVEEGVFVVRGGGLPRNNGGEGMPRNNACIDLAALAAHAERQVQHRRLDCGTQSYQ